MPKGPQGQRRPALVIGAAVLVEKIATEMRWPLLCAGALFFHYNFCRQHKPLRVSPAMQAGIADRLMSMADLCAMMDEANPPKKRGVYKKRAVS